MGGDLRRRDSRARELLQLAAVATIPFLLFAAHGAFFSSWEIDDAGISYAYARNLLAGEGLVAQPGSEPVEGFTNLLWVVVLAAVLPLPGEPGVAARVISHGLVFAGFLALAAGARAWFPRRWRPVAIVGLSTSALVTGFAAWTLSGLENALYACLVAVFLVATTQAPDSPRAGVAVGGLWILLIATRPDAAPLVVLPAMAWAARRAERCRTPFALTAAGGLLALTGFRAVYFHDVFPNTFYAKRGPGWRHLAEVDWTPAAGLAFGLAGALVLVALLRVVWSLTARGKWLRRRTPQQLGLMTLWLALVLSYLIYETLPTDWMSEGRFATAVFLLAPIAVLGLVQHWKVLLGGASVALVAATVWYSAKHTPAFAGSPPAPFGPVLNLADRLAAVGDALGSGRETSVLLPDIGGALWRDRFVVVDVAGLIDPRIARTVRANDRSGFFDYIFEVRKPDLIWSHDYWRTLADLESDARLARDYELLYEDELHTLHVRSASRAIERGRLLAAFTE